MLVRQADEDGFRYVLRNELFLRRVLRWELRGRYGRQWLVALGSSFESILKRIEHEKKFGAYNRDHSELAYLDLSEVVNLFFGTFWDAVFRATGLTKGSHEVFRRTLLTTRNKVAHFRPIDHADLGRLKDCSELLVRLKEHYQSSLEASAHLSGAEMEIEGQFDREEINAIQASLAGRQVTRVWEEFGAFEGVRAMGLSPGIGVVGHHLFVEVFAPSPMAADVYIRFANQWRDSITFLNFGAMAEFVRIFVPFSIGEQEIAKVLRAFGRAAHQCNFVEDAGEDHIESVEFDLGYLEHVGAAGKNIECGYVF